MMPILTILRGNVLPKIISGELCVSETEEITKPNLACPVIRKQAGNFYPKHPR